MPRPFDATQRDRLYTALAFATLDLTDPDLARLVLLAREMARAAPTLPQDSVSPVEASPTPTHGQSLPRGTP